MNTCACMCGEQRATSRVFIYAVYNFLPPELFHYNLILSDCLELPRNLLFHLPTLELQTPCYPTLAFYMCTGDSSTCPYVCVASAALPTAPSPQPTQ